MKDRLFFSSSVNDEAYYLKDTIFVKFNVRRNGISTSKLNGGFSSNLKSVFNHHLTQEHIDYLENHDVCDYLINKTGIKPDADIEFSGVELRRRGDFIFALNFTPEKQVIKTDCEYTDVFSGKKITGDIDVDGYGCRVLKT